MQMRKEIPCCGNGKSWLLRGTMHYLADVIGMKINNRMLEHNLVLWKLCISRVWLHYGRIQRDLVKLYTSTKSVSIPHRMLDRHISTTSLFKRYPHGQK